MVVDPSATGQLAVKRAAGVAGSLKRALDLLIRTHAGLSSRVTGGNLQVLRREHSRLVVRPKAVWDRLLHEGIIRETLRSGAVADSIPAAARQLRANLAADRLQERGRRRAGRVGRRFRGQAP